MSKASFGKKIWPKAQKVEAVEQSASRVPIRTPTQAPFRLGRDRAASAEQAQKLQAGAKTALPITATALRIWQHSHLQPLAKLPEALQDRILILRNHPEVCAMSHKQKVISYTEHQDYLRELKRSRPKYDCCALYCEAIQFLPQSVQNTKGAQTAKSLQDLEIPSRREPEAQTQAQVKAESEDEGFRALRPIVGVVNVDLRIPEHPLLGLYKNLYHYPHIRIGRILLFAAMLRASELGLAEIFLECYSRNVAMQKLARQLGFRAEAESELASAGDLRGKLLSFQRALPSRKKLLQDPMFSDFGELYREAKSLRDKEYLH